MANKIDASKALPTPTHHQLVKLVVDTFRAYGCPAWPTHGPRNRPVHEGVTDVEAVLRPSGRFVAMEVKRPGDKLSGKQEEHAWIIKGAGGVVRYVRDAKEAVCTVGELVVKAGR